MILVDTGPLVALCDPRDGLHATASRHLRRHAAAGLVTCDAVLTESCFHLPHASQRRRVAAVLNTFRIGMVETHPLTFRHAVFDWLNRYAEHEPDWADGCLVVACARDARLRVWTYDREFVTTWRLPSGTRIPLAVRPPNPEP
jgi:predicted nucleic acid-binding protein